MKLVQVKGGHINLSQLAEQWLVRSSKIFEDTFSAHACAVLLKEAEQFLWAGSEMDLVCILVFRSFILLF